MSLSRLTSKLVRHGGSILSAWLDNLSNKVETLEDNSQRVCYTWRQAQDLGYIKWHTQLNSANEELLVYIDHNTMVIEGIIRVTGNAISSTAIMYTVSKFPDGVTSYYKPFCQASALGTQSSDAVTGAFTRQRSGLTTTMPAGISVEGWVSGNATTVLVRETYNLIRS